MTRFRRAGLGWHTPPSLNALMDEIEAWDSVRRLTDGTLGDITHSSRESDHNPDENGIVRACDAGESDDAQGDYLAEKLLASQDDRIAYVIHDGRRFLGAKYAYLRGRKPWVWIPYTGVNAHLKHNHTSVNASQDDNAKPWNLFDITVPVSPQEENMWQKPGDFVEDLDDARRVHDWHGHKVMTEADFDYDENDPKYMDERNKVFIARLLSELMTK